MARVESTNHPCFNSRVKHRSGRVHLPVAPKCNIQCNYCYRKYDCVNESRPGVSSTVLSPEQAAFYFFELKKENPWMEVAGIAGPGDALANPEQTLETMRLIREKLPETTFCLSTNGLMLDEYIEELHELGLRFLTVTMNAVDPEVGKDIYGWVRYRKRGYRGIEAASLLLEKQLSGLEKAVKLGWHVKVNTIIIPGVNDGHIEEVARTVAGLGVEIQNCLPLIPVKESAFGELSAPDAQMTKTVRAKASSYVHQMMHCGRCRSDAAGLVGKKTSDQVIDFLSYVRNLPKDMAEKRKHFAVSSQEGLLVNLHLGETRSFHIYTADSSGVKFLEKRTAPAAGKGDARWEDLAGLLSDCRALFTVSIGSRPEEVLASSGLQVYKVQGLISGILEAYHQGDSLKQYAKLPGFRAPKGSGCGGTAMGCM